MSLQKTTIFNGQQGRFGDEDPAAGKIKTLLDNARQNRSSERFALKKDIWQTLQAQRSIVEIDARKLSGFFLPAIIARAKFLNKNSILLIRQSFEPLPLFNILGKLGFVYYSEKISENEYCVYFVRKKEI